MRVQKFQKCAYITYEWSLGRLQIGRSALEKWDLKGQKTLEKVGREAKNIQKKVESQPATLVQNV